MNLILKSVPAFAEGSERLTLLTERSVADVFRVSVHPMSASIIFRRLQKQVQRSIRISVAVKAIQHRTNVLGKVRALDHDLQC